MQGNKSTTPRGIEMLELPFSLSGRLKNANLELVFVLVFTSSIDGRFGDEGMRFRTLCTKPIGAVAFADRWEITVERGRVPHRSRQSVVTITIST
jgi:hypothetical protein